jgi:hypothetical protein
MANSITMTAVRSRYERAKNAGVITNYVQQYIDTVWKEATRAFVYATASAMNADTGMSMASLLNLAGKVGMKGEVLAQISAKKKSGPKPGIQNAERYGMPSNNLPQKSIAAGEMLGASAYTFNMGDRAASRWVFRLRFNINVLQWAFHEDDWNAVQKGMMAFEIYFETNMLKLMPAQMQTDYIQRGIKPVNISVDRLVNTYGDD